MQHTRPPPGILCVSYQCNSMACLDRAGLEFGDKIIMPQAAFKEAHRLRLRLPLLFKVVNSSRRIGAAGPAPCQFCGVLEFSAPKDQVFLPYWMMQNLFLSEGGRVELRSILRPPAGSFVRFRPHDDSFLDVAAQQGPKALMEGALRRYSVLSEGVTILVQHEGENYYLDVSEVRTLTPPSSLGWIKDSEGAEESWRTGGNRNERTSSGGDSSHDLTGAAGGKPIRLVSLLGDVDLEVEFSAPDLPSGATLSSQKPTDTKIIGSFSTTTRGAVSTDCANVEGGGARSTLDASKNKPTLPLPAPARAKREQMATEVLAPQLTGRLGGLGIRRFSGLSSSIPNKSSKCRIFYGKGVALGCALSAEDRRTALEKAESGQHWSSFDQMEEEETHPPCRGQESAAMKTAGNCWEKKGGGNNTGRRSGWPGGGCLPTGDTLSLAMRSEREVDSRLFGEGLSVAMAAGAKAKEAAAAPEEGAAIAEAADAVGCRSCGRSVPAANLYLHELRCPSTVGKPGHIHTSSLSSSATVFKPARGRSEPESRQLLRTDGVILGEAPSKTAGREVATPELEEGYKYPSNGEDEVDTPVEMGSVEKREYSEGSSEMANCSRGRIPGRNRKEGSPTDMPRPLFSCAYCGLSFRTVDSAASHEGPCGARTERCGCCCSLVSRREGESHRRPGGGCDAAIAAAIAAEEEGLLAAAAVSAAATGTTAAATGDTNVYNIGDVDHLKRGISIFDGRLAQAVMSSREASTAVLDVRARNDGLTASLAGMTLRPRTAECISPRSGATSALTAATPTHDDCTVDRNGKREADISFVCDSNATIPAYFAEDMGTGNSGKILDNDNRQYSVQHPPSGSIIEGLTEGVETSSGSRTQSIFSRGEQLVKPGDEGNPNGMGNCERETEMTLTPLRPHQAIGFARSGISWAPASANAAVATRGEKEPNDGGEFSPSVGFKWGCSLCTLVNPRGAKACEACGTARGGDSGDINGRRESREDVVVLDDPVFVSQTVGVAAAYTDCRDTTAARVSSVVVTTETFLGPTSSGYCTESTVPPLPHPEIVSTNQSYGSSGRRPRVRCALRSDRASSLITPASIALVSSSAPHPRRTRNVSPSAVGNKDGTLPPRAMSALVHQATVAAGHQPKVRPQVTHKGIPRSVVAGSAIATERRPMPNSTPGGFIVSDALALGLNAEVGMPTAATTTATTTNARRLQRGPSLRERLGACKRQRYCGVDSVSLGEARLSRRNWPPPTTDRTRATETNSRRQPLANGMPGAAAQSLQSMAPNAGARRLGGVHRPRRLRYLPHSCLPSPHVPGDSKRTLSSSLSETVATVVSSSVPTSSAKCSPPELLVASSRPRESDQQQRRQQQQRPADSIIKRDGGARRGYGIEAGGNYFSPVGGITAPACGLSLSVLGTRRGKQSCTDHVIECGDVHSQARIEEKGVDRRRGLLHGWAAEARNKVSGEGRRPGRTSGRVGVAPAKLRQRVGHTRVLLEPL